MSCILHIETSGGICSVALSQDGAVIHAAADHDSMRHAERLGSMVQEALSFADNHAIPLDAVAVSGGPGSYTGLRVGVSMAKGVCYGRDAKLIAVPTLELLCVPVLIGEVPKEDDALLCPMIDARRMEVYAQLFDRSLREVRPVQADVVTADTYKQWLDQRTVYFFGDGAEKCQDIIRHPNARFVHGVEALAKNMLPLAEQRLARGLTEDVAYYVPFYLKDFVAKPARKLI